MDFGVANRVVVITGASRGLGRKCAEAFAEQGASLGLLARDISAIKDLAEGLPSDSVPVECDVSDRNAVISAFGEVAKRLGAVDSVVSNAGILSKTARVQDLPIEVWDEVIGTNLTGAFHVACAAHQYLRNSHAGRMVLVSSGAAKMPMHGSSAYAASKAGVEGLARALCTDWAVDGICVNAVAPGYIDNGNPTALPDHVRKLLVSKTPLRRVGEASEFVSVVLFLASNSSGFITGQTLGVDGGYGLD